MRVVTETNVCEWMGITTCVSITAKLCPCGNICSGGFWTICLKCLWRILGAPLSSNQPVVNHQPANWVPVLGRARGQSSSAQRCSTLSGASLASP